MPSIDDTYKLFGVATVGALVLTACGNGDDDAETQGMLLDSDTLQVCSDLPYPPFEYYDADGEIVGFDMDIAEEIADELDVELEVIASSFDGIQSGVALNAQDCDMAISGMTITEERGENMLFSEPYLDDNLGLLAAADAGVDSLDDLDGVAVGVQQATTGADYAQEEGYDIREYEDSGLLIQGLESGQVDAAIGNISILGYQAGEDEAFTFVEEIDTGEQLGIAVQQDNTELHEAINDILADMDLEEIEERWFHEGETPEEGDDADADADDADEEADDEEEDD